jgi:hypothetical protein
MALLKQMIVGGIAAIIAMGLAMPLAHANPTGGREIREAGRKGGTQAEEELRKQRAVKRAQRLSPEERRQLRRDIKDAGREIYPQRR